MRTLFTNAKALLQIGREGLRKISGKKMSELPLIENAWLLCENGLIHSYGTMDQDLPSNADEIINAQDKFILPTWIDSHTHLVFAGNREGEFVDRIKGLSYEEIANKGGGILNSAEKLNKASEDELYEAAAQRLHKIIGLGTGAIEIKSGYGLTLEGEIKMLNVIKRLKKNFPIPIKSTFLGAHALPMIYKKDKQAYLDLIINHMIPEIKENQLADYIDIFCEKGYFDLEDTDQILKAGQEAGLKAKTHVNQFNAFGGVQKSVEYNALSVDHLEVIDDSDILSLQSSKTMPVALPGCSLFLTIPYTPARKIIDSGLPLALATDYNPGSCPSGNMNLVVSLASIKMNMTPEESINAATLNGAYALELEGELGSIDTGKKANLILTKKIPSYGYLPYSFGENNIDSVYINGKLWQDSTQA